ncbi:two-component sensor histidine kinase, partial [Pseudoduganella sp. RAF53_2]
MRRFWPQSLLARLSLVMVAGLLLAQIVASVIWATQLRAKTEADVKSAAQYLGQGAASSIRFFKSLPPSYRSLLIQQFREMGGTRFYVALNRAEVTVREIAPQALAQTALTALDARLRNDLPGETKPRLAFAWPDQLVVSPDGIHVGDLPEAWVRHILLLKP